MRLLVLLDPSNALSDIWCTLAASASYITLTRSLDSAANLCRTGWADVVVIMTSSPLSGAMPALAHVITCAEGHLVPVIVYAASEGSPSQHAATPETDARNAAFLVGPTALEKHLEVVLRTVPFRRQAMTRRHPALLEAGPVLTSA